MKKIIKKFLKTFDYKLLKISKNKSSIEIILEIILNKNISLTLDIGANTGQFASDLREAGYKGKIISFEPLSYEHEILKKNSINDASWSVYSRCAIGNLDGNIDINVSSYSPSSSLLQFTETHKSAKPEARMVKKENVPIYKLDTIASDLKLNDTKYFLKIDTQGYEKFILDGAINSLKNCEVVFCEVSFKPMYQNQELWLEIINFLKSKNFEIASIENGVFDKKNILLQADIIFIK